MTSPMEMTEVLIEDGCAMACCHGIVLGYWYVPLNTERMRACGERYSSVTARHGAFSVFTVFRVNPYGMNAVLSSSVRDETVRVLDTHAETIHSLICILEGSPLMAATMRLSAAATARVVKNAKALSFWNTIAGGLPTLAKAPATIDEATLMGHLAILEAGAARSAPKGTFRSIQRPLWALPIDTPLP